MKLIREQNSCPGKRGTFGPLGSVRKNGCGAIALYNLLQLLGYQEDYGSILADVNRHWLKATVLGGLLGMNPWFLLHYLSNKADKAAFHFTTYRLWNAHSALKIQEHHMAYLNLYFYRYGGHYATSAFYDGRLEIYNDGSSQGYKEYFQSEKAVYMVVVGIDKR